MKYLLICVLLHPVFALNYSEDISPIIYNNCTTCHRSGEIASFLPLTNYGEVFNNRNWIAYAIVGDESRHGDPIMPPWPPDREYSTFIGERYLTEDEIHNILDWIGEGASQGDPELEYPMPDFPEGSAIGEPDMTFEMDEPYFINGNFEDDYRCFIFSLDNNEDISMSAIEFRPGNREAVHHAIITYIPAGAAAELDNQGSGYGYECYGGFGLSTVTDLIGGYAPGLSVLEYPEGIGRTIPANSDIIVQVHYAPLIDDAEDLSSINIFYKDEAIEREINQEIFDYWGFYLLPDQETTITRTLYIDETVSMVNILPHCHLLGKSWEIYATTPSSEIIPIIRINQWDFDWQSFYYPEYLLKIPAGSTITATCIYDNTSNNPDNPNDPPALVFPGQGTTDEMFFIPIEFIPYQEGDENIYLGNEDMLLGDVNGDGTLNVLDVVQLVNMILSGGDISPASDVNGDGALNVLDIVQLVNLILS